MSKAIQKPDPLAGLTDTQRRIVKVIGEQLGVDETSAEPSASLSLDLHADSLDLVEIVMALEEEFNIEISDAEISWEEPGQQEPTVQQIFDIVERKKAKKK